MLGRCNAAKEAVVRARSDGSTAAVVDELRNVADALEVEFDDASTLARDELQWLLTTHSERVRRALRAAAVAQAALAQSAAALWLSVLTNVDN